MGIEIRLPNITGASEKEQLLQLKSYLYQLSEQLQYAFDNINTTGGSGNGYVVKEAPRGFTASSGGSGVNAEATFAAIKSLIIKSADIVNAYYDEINKKLEGAYVAQSDFGVFAEKTTQDIQANSTGITQTFENVQLIIRETKDEIDGDLKTIGETASDLDGKITNTNGRIDETNGAVSNLGDGLDNANSRIDGVDKDLQGAKTNINAEIQRVSNSVSEVDRLRLAAEEALVGSIDDLEFDLAGLRAIVAGVTAYVKSGLLYYTDAGIPVYGIEIGQQVESNGTEVFNKFARFTSEKLSFYDANGNEVAYISDKKLYIGQAEITISLKVGGLVDYVMANGDVVTKWEGGS